MGIHKAIQCVPTDQTNFFCFGSVHFAAVFLTSRKTARVSWRVWDVTIDRIVLGNFYTCKIHLKFSKLLKKSECQSHLKNKIVMPNSSFKIFPQK